MIKNIVMTGATSGFGAEALRSVVRSGGCKVLVGARDASRLPSGLGLGVRTAHLDLSDLASAAAFANEAAGSGLIDALVLNAGISPRRLETTLNGFDRAFQVNYLSHFLIVQRMLDKLAPGAVVIATSSGTHDPEENTPPPPPKHADAMRLAYPDKDPDRDRMGMRAAARSYTASKLCMVLLAKELARRKPDLTSLAFDPGLVPGTGLVREFPPLLVKFVMPLMIRSMPPDRTGDIESTATAFADLIAENDLLQTLDAKSGDYIAMRGGRPKIVHASTLAEDSQVATRLWNDSMKLLHEAGFT